MAEARHGLQQTAFETVGQIVDANPSIIFVSVVAYHDAPNWRDLRQATLDPELPFLVRGLQQDPGERIVTKIPRAEASADNLQVFAGNLRESLLFAVTSRVELASGKSGHIPMMDFMAPPSSKNLDVLTGLVGALSHRRGWLLESGRSYHYYGDDILDDEEWRTFLGKCLLMSGYVDDRYIGHQLVDGHCVLRLSTGKSKTTMPKVVAEV